MCERKKTNEYLHAVNSHPCCRERLWVFCVRESSIYTDLKGTGADCWLPNGRGAVLKVYCKSDDKHCKHFYLLIFLYHSPLCIHKSLTFLCHSPAVIQKQKSKLLSNHHKFFHHLNKNKIKNWREKNQINKSIKKRMMT